METSLPIFKSNTNRIKIISDEMSRWWFYWWIAIVVTHKINFSTLGILIIFLYAIIFFHQVINLPSIYKHCRSFLKKTALYSISWKHETSQHEKRTEIDCNLLQLGSDLNMYCLLICAYTSGPWFRSACTCKYTHAHRRTHKKKEVIWFLKMILFYLPSTKTKKFTSS